MSNIESSTARSPFFPNSKESVTTKRSKALSNIRKNRNTPERMQEIKDMTNLDAKVKINNAVKDFSRIKKAVDAAPEIDNTDKIARLKSQINNGTYKLDYDALADKILTSEF